MLSVIVTPGDPQRLAGLLAALTPAAVEGLVREVLIATQGPGELLHAVCDHTGAELTAGMAAAVGAAKSDLLLVTPPEFRPREGWVERLGDFLREDGREAVLVGLGGGFLRKGPQALLLPRTKAASVDPQVDRLRRVLGAGARRLG